MRQVEAGRTPPLVSVVIPTHRRVELLTDCVRSVLAQTERSIEVIVVVDGADAPTERFLESIEDERLRFVVHDEPTGVCVARNDGISSSRGRWVAFCDDDDVWAPTKLERQLAELESCPQALWSIVSAVRLAEGASIGKLTLAPEAAVVATALPHWNVVPGGCSGVIADRELVIDVGAFDPRLSALADSDLWIRLNWRSPVAVVEEPLVGYRDHPGAMTRQLRRVEDELCVMRAKYGVELAADARRFPDDRFYRWAYRRTFGNGDYRGGILMLFRSPGFRSTTARWIVEKVRVRTGAVNGPLAASVAVVEVADHSWLTPISAHRHP